MKARFGGHCQRAGRIVLAGWQAGSTSVKLKSTCIRVVANTLNAMKRRKISDQPMDALVNAHRSPSTRYELITITNLSNKTLTLKNISINRSRSAGCSFNPAKTAPLGGSSTLEPGAHFMVANLAMLMGTCGSIMRVDVLTDHGTFEMDIDW